MTKNISPHEDILALLKIKTQLFYIQNCYQTFPVHFTIDTVICVTDIVYRAVKHYHIF